MRDRSGNYRLMYQLGRGGMGQVWGGVRLGDEDMVMPCAIKVLHPALAQTEQERQRFFNEARIAAQLDHGRIVKVIETSEVQGSPCIVMEWVDGVNLREFLEKVHLGLDLGVCLYIIGEILTALEYAHDRTVAGADAGVIHYDVTPGNILVSSSGEVKLTDFGIARFSATADGTMSRSMGTPRYMSPEQLNGRARRETDIYSLGVVLHELLDGRRYLDGCDRQQLQTLVLDGYVPDLDRPGTPAWVDQLRRQMLAARPEDRPRAVEALTLIVERTPHYQLAAQQLRVLYRHYIGERRSGLTQLLDTEDVPDIYRRPGQQRAPTPTPADGVVQSGQSRGSTKTGMPSFEAPITVTEVLADSLPDAPLAVEVAPPAPAALPSRRWLWSGLGAAALILLGASLGAMVARSGGEPAVVDTDVGDPHKELPTSAFNETTPTTNEMTPTPTQEPARPPGREPVPAKQPAAQADPTPAPEPEVEPEPVTEPESEPDTQSEPDTTSEPKPAKKPRKVVVTFVIAGATKAQLQIGSRTLDYNHMAMTDLRPGHYTVRWRESDDAPWHAAGRIRVEELAKGGYYEVQVGAKSVRLIQREEGSAQ